MVVGATQRTGEIYNYIMTNEMPSWWRSWSTMRDLNYERSSARMPGYIRHVVYVHISLMLTRIVILETESLNLDFVSFMGGANGGSRKEI